MTRVEFRFLHFVVSPVSDDRITIGMLHWDGRELRFAHSTGRLPAALSVHRKTLDRELKAIKREVRKLEGESANLLSLTDVYRVTEGYGSALCWTQVRVGQTQDPAAHFAELRSLAALGSERRPDTGKAIREVREGLERLAHELAPRAGDRVRTKMKVSRRKGTEHAYVSPLSWKNGAWHHTIPLSLAKEPAAMADDARQVVGLVQVDFPKKDKAVIVAVLPKGRKLAQRAREEAELIREAAGARVDVMTAAAGQRAKVLRQLEKRILREVSEAAE